MTGGGGGGHWPEGGVTHLYDSGSSSHFRTSVSALHRSGTTIDDPYVDGGVSITHGNPREHIWTLASGHSARTSI